MEDRATKKYISAAYQYAFSRLVLHSTLFCENMLEGPKLSEEEEEIKREFGCLLKSLTEGTEELLEVEKLRNRISAGAEILTAYSDCFQIYEYVVSRTERRFVKLPPSDYTPEEMADALLDTLVDLGQRGSPYSYLKTVISYLPVRLTRQKFYSMVMERLSIYTGDPKGDVEEFLYMLKTSAMALLPEHMDKEKELYQALETLRQTDFQKLDKAGYETCRTVLTRGDDLLAEKTDFYVSVQEMLNELYILCLTKDKRAINTSSDQAFWQGIKKIQEALETGEGLSYEEEERILERMEGIQEEVEDIVMAGSPDFSDPVLKKLERLMSGSRFAPLEEEEASQEAADREWIEQKGKELCGDFDKLFASLPRAVTRSVMAAVISKLPLKFDSRQEIWDYIRLSLESCTDYAEREACLEFLEQELRE